MIAGDSIAAPEIPGSIAIVAIAMQTGNMNM